MNKNKLSQRLNKVCQYINQQARIADIGSDHAYLPCYAIEANIASFAIAGEVVDGPFQSAKQQVIESKLTDRISVRKGDGLEVIDLADCIDTITIAGMGGPLIASILEKGKEKLAGVKKLILQPNVGANHIRNWCMVNNWRIVSEAIIEEDNKIYEILVLQPSDTTVSYTEKELLFGPYLLEQKNEVFVNKWTSEHKQWENVIKKLAETENTPQIEEKKALLQKKIDFVKEVL